ncbi:hypothetical protein [Halorhabdus rudnickae]|uniref:hypothetical protein n=1 Tax=Halorhabdus rudnickae TaxID=1775544 RepID=UPI001FCE48AE|nr:hypothetical protein [Halorhabdus rudnickae]
MIGLADEADFTEPLENVQAAFERARDDDDTIFSKCSAIQRHPSVMAPIHIIFINFIPNTLYSG